MRIGLISHFYTPEPLAIPAGIAAGLCDRGHDVRVLTGFPNYPSGRLYDGYRIRARRHEVIDGIGVTRVAVYPSHDRSAVRRAANYLSFAAGAATLGLATLRSADLAYVYFSPATAAVPAVVLRALRGTPYVLHVQDMWPEAVLESGMLGSGAARTLGDRLLTPACAGLYRRAAAVIAIAPTMREQLLARGVRPDRAYTVPNWTDETLFRPAPCDPAAAAELGTAGRFTVMYAGNLGAYQALETAIAAAARLRDLPEFQLVLAGSGIAEERLRALAASLGAGNVRFLPHRPPERMAALARAADIHLVSLRDLPIFAGTIPSKTQSLLAAGLPVIAAVPGDAADLVRGAGAGIVCPPEDVAALAAAFRRAAALPAVRLAEMGRRARAYYEDHLSMRTALGEIDMIVRTATGHPRVRQPVS